MSLSTAANDAAAASGTGVAHHEFLRVLGHEIRNHLAPIQNAMHVLRLRGRADPMLAPVLDIIERQVSGMVQTLDTIVEAERASRGDLPLRPARVGVRQWLGDIVEPLRKRALERGQTIDLHVADDVLDLDADPARLARAVQAVLDNAIRHGPEHAPIEVRAYRDAGDLAVDVSDRGAGLPKSLQPHAFEFLAARNHHGHGIGIGLPLAHTIVTAHGGTVTLASSEQGTTVRMRLPLVSPLHPAVATAPASVATSTPRMATPIATGAHGRRILIADDSAAVRTSLADLLRDMGHEVETAGDGLEAVERARAGTPDFVLIDIHMPKLNGFEVARQLRQEFPSSAMRLVMLSGNDLDEVMMQGARTAGFDEFVDKGRAIEALDALLGSTRP